MTNQSSSLQPSFTSSPISSPSPATKSILLPTVSPLASGIAFRNQSRDRKEYSSPCGGDICNYDETIAKRRIHTSPHPSETQTQTQAQLQTQPPTYLRNDSNQFSVLTTPPRGRLPTASSTLLSHSPASAPLYGRNQPTFNSPNGSGTGRYQASPLDHQSQRRYQSGLSLSPSFPTSPLAGENGLCAQLNHHSTLCL
jgi:hypothetical protein